MAREVSGEGQNLLAASLDSAEKATGPIPQKGKRIAAAVV
jgi:hypothetical protein